ncbi:hypothetical protein SLS58_009594 [Diplodia intermedia]|uniref:Protein kinase domain-containing protein n=1 Tax=Diplodia intermedia TaxID=856260 RepID=A0ABR3TB17_9PEZI
MDLGIGAVSLTFQVFSGCMKGYQLLTEARNMEAEHKYMRIQLKKEQHRLLDWGHVAGVGVRDDELVISSSDKGLLHDVLEQQQNLLLEFGRYETRYKKGPLERLKKPFVVVDEIFELDDDEAAAAVEASSPRPLLRAADTDFETRFPEGEELLKKALNWAKGARSFPKRLRWAAFDKEKMEALLLRLSRLNDFLRELLTTQQLSHLNLRQEQTCYQIIQLNNKMDQLVEIVKAGSEWSNLTSNGRSDAHGSSPSAHGSGRMNLALRAKELLQDLPLMPLSRVESMEYVRGEAQERGLPNRSLTQLARFKALETAISGQQSLTDDRATALQLGPASSITDVELPAVLFTLTLDDDDDGDQNRRAEALFGAKRVWIEWKTYEPRVFDGEPDQKVVKRIEALVVLLKENSRSCQFRAPRCLGYFRDIDVETGEDRCRFGVVFEKPSSVPPSTQPISLLDLLRATERGTMDTPSLTERAKLAKVVTKALEELHAVNWLHKGLRSENILFFECELDPEDLRPDNYYDEQREPLSLELDLSTPYLSGFDYARPAQNEDLTEKPPENAAYDLYRHPDVQGSRAEGDNAASFQKTFDIYALGIILLEIAYWQPIDRILKIDLPKARPSTTLRVRNRLLSERKLLGHVKSHAGVVLEQVVRACLIGAEALVDGFTGGKFDEKEPVQAVQLQAGFYKHVVEKLAEVKI